jgi:hypothetical protein
MDDRFPRFPRLAGRRRLLILLLAVATAITVVLTLLYPPGGVQRKRPPPPPEPARCTAGQQTDCVGGKAEVIALPPAASAAN